MLDDEIVHPALAGTSSTTRMVRRALTALATTRVNVLLQGEPGTGKLQCATLLHARGTRRGAARLPIVPLGGCERRWTDDAVSAAILRALSAATGGTGTVYLEGVESLSRVLQRRLASTLARDDLGVRLISSSPTYLEENVRLGLFCPELYRRLGAVQVRLPPLRDRVEDIGAIVDACLRRRARCNGVAAPTLTTAALHVMRRYRWPGNVAELERLVEALCATAAEEVTAPHVRGLLRKLPSSLHAKPHLLTLRQAKGGWLRTALERLAWNQTTVARRLGISRNTVVRFMRAHHLDSDTAS